MKKIEIFIPPGLIFALLGFQFIYAYDYFDLSIWGMEFISLLMIIGLCVLAYKLQSKLILAIILFVKSVATMFLLFFLAVMHRYTRWRNGRSCRYCNLRDNDNIGVMYYSGINNSIYRGIKTFDKESLVII